jgi:hypothetical protein
VVETILKFKARSDHADLRLDIKFNGSVLHQDLAVREPRIIEICMDDDIEQDHLLEISMQGKTSLHTTLDDQGNIVDDALVKVSEFSMDDIVIDQLVWENARYHHDHNGSSEAQDHDFFGSMGCNGTVRLAFHTPVYLWLLEKM